MRDDELEARYQALEQSAPAGFSPALRRFVDEGGDRELNRVNVLDFAARYGVDEEDAITGFVHAARVGLFDLSWNLLCPGCGGVLGANATLKSMRKDEYHCAICTVAYTPTLDEIVEASFCVNRRTRRIPGHEPESLPFWEYLRQFFWSSGIELPEGEDFDRLVRWRVAFRKAAMGDIDGPELERTSRADISAQLPASNLFILEGPEPLSVCSFNARLPDMVQIGNVWTPPELRGNGYARAVVAGALEIAKQSGVTAAVLATARENIAAKAAYRSIGFKLVGDYVTLRRRQ